MVNLKEKYKLSLLVIFIMILASCSMVNYQRIWVKGKTAIDITKFNKIYISDFRVTSQIKNELLNKNIKNILKGELSIYHKNNLIFGEKVNLSEKGIFNNPLFWREYAPDGDIIITGEINLDKKEREQIVSERKTSLSLKKVNKLETVKIVETTISFYIIKTATGKIIYKYKFNNKIMNDRNDSDLVIINRVFSIAVERLLNRIVSREHINYRYLFNY